MAVTADRMTGMNDPIVYSIITTSMAKMTPAMGVLNDPPMAAAVPQATRVRKALLGSSRAWPRRLALAAPRWMAGPSRPPEMPAIRAMMPPKNWATALRMGR